MVTNAVRWTNELLADGVDESVHLSVEPELVVEIWSSGQGNEHRDRVTAKLFYLSRKTKP